MAIYCDLDLFYGAPIVCGCSKCQGLKEKPYHVRLTNYTNDWIPNVDGLIPPSAEKNPIGDIEKTHRKTSLCLFLETLEAKTTMFHHKLTKPIAYV